MAPTFLFFGALFAGLGVAAGAFGAHFLKDVVAADRLAVFDTAVRYQMYHALALLILGGLLERARDRYTHVAGWCFIAGIVVFSGSLYVVALAGIRWAGAMTPLGGLAFLVGWIALVRLSGRGKRPAK